MKTANELKEIVINKKAMVYEQANHEASTFVENVIAPQLEQAAEQMRMKAIVEIPIDKQMLKERMANILRSNGYTVNMVCGGTDLTIMW